MAWVGYEPRSGALFVFIGCRRQLVEILFADATGTCVFAKRLDSGVFSPPAAAAADASHVEIDESTLDALLDGLALVPSAESAAPPAGSRRRRVIDLAREKMAHRVSTAIACVHTESFVSDTTSALPSDGHARVDALTAEVASLRDDNTTLRDELVRARTALANLRVR